MGQAVLEKENTSQEASLDATAWVFKALSDPARLKILKHLATQESTTCCGSQIGLCACDFESVTGLKQPTVSHHMKCLISAGLVKGEKRGKWMFYHLNTEGVELIQPMLALLK